jgi:hypothetical protein
MREHVFFFRDGKTENDADRDWVKYIEVNDIKIGHGLSICGSCFCGGRLSEVDVHNTVSFIGESDLQKLFDYDTAVHSLGWNIKDDPEKMAKATELFEAVKPIFDKLLSKDNKKFFEEEIVPVEDEYLKDEYNLSDAELEEIFDNYYQDYRDRSVINYVYDDVEDFGRNEASNMGVFGRDNANLEQYFDFEEYGEDLINDQDMYYKLEDGRVVCLSY